MRFYCWSEMGQDPPLSAMHQCVLMPNYSDHLLGRVAMQSVICGYCWRCFVVCVCMCVTHGHNHQPCKNGRTDRCLVFSVDSGLL